jgi:hypothetical protein
MTLAHDPGDDLRPLLAAAASGGPAHTDLLAGVRRTQRRRRVLVPVGSVATAGALGLAAFAVFSVAGPDSAQAKVAAAAEHTSGQSFRVHIVNGGSYDGAFDPVHQTGRLAFPGGGQNLYVGGTVYVTNVGPKAAPLPAGKHWISSPRLTKADWTKLGTAIEVIKLGPQDPQLVLQQLRSATHVREVGAASGAGWSGRRYSFPVANEADAKTGELSATGSVAVDSHGLARVLDLTVRSEGGKGGQQVTHSVIEFSDYGTPVEVSAPPADQVISSDQVLPPRSGQGPHKTAISKSPGA